MRRVRPDLVHANSSKAGVLGRLAAVLMRVPVRVFTVHGWAFKAYTGLAALLYRWADQAMARWPPPPSASPRPSARRGSRPGRAATPAPS